MKTLSSFGSSLMAETGGSGFTDGVISLRLGFLAVDFRGVMVSVATGVANISSCGSVSDVRYLLDCDLGIDFLELTDGVAVAFLSSVSAVDALTLALERPLLPVAVDTVDGVGGGGIESLAGVPRWSS